MEDFKGESHDKLTKYTEERFVGTKLSALRELLGCESFVLITSVVKGNVKVTLTRAMLLGGKKMTEEILETSEDFIKAIKEQGK